LTNNKEGGQNLIKTMIEKYGSREAWVAFLKESASKGGSVSHPETRAFTDRKRASEIGRLGGLKSAEVRRAKRASDNKD
jgi:general stress protein YciG